MRIGLVIDHLDDPVYPDLIDALTRSADAAGYAVVVRTVRDASEGARAVEDLSAREVDGLAFMVSWPPSVIAGWIGDAAPPVVIANTDGGGTEHPQFGSDNLAGTRLAGDHLIRLGHRHIAWIGGPPNVPFNQPRLEGYRAAWREASLDPDLIEVIAGDGTETAGERAARRLAATPARTTAIACYNDRTATGVLRSLADAGVRVPEDVSVVGFDDIPLAAWLAPPLTTVAQQTAAFGRLAIERLTALMPVPVPERSAGVPVRLSVSLKVRRSTGPAPAREPLATEGGDDRAAGAPHHRTRALYTDTLE